jgi:hypothetical protein
MKQWLFGDDMQTVSRNAINNIIKAYFVYHNKAQEAYDEADMNLDGPEKDRILRKLVEEGVMRLLQIKEKLEQ